MPLPGVRRGHPVLRGVPAGGFDGAAAGASRPGKRGGPAAHHQPVGAGQEERVRALPLALLHRLPEVSHLCLPLLHLWSARAALGKVSCPESGLEWGCS